MPHVKLSSRAKAKIAIVQHRWILRLLCVLVDSISSQARGSRCADDQDRAVARPTCRSCIAGGRIGTIFCRTRFFAGRRLPAACLVEMSTWVFDAFDTAQYYSG
jgi:hypothetical protein